jgi:hypothetical protein
LDIFNGKIRAESPRSSKACFIASPMVESCFDEKAITLGPAPDNAAAEAPDPLAASIAACAPGINGKRCG